jgi:hypothetical protein
MIAASGRPRPGAAFRLQASKLRHPLPPTAALLGTDLGALFLGRAAATSITLLWNRYTPFLETRAKDGTVTVTERVIQYGGRQSVVPHQKHGVP